MNKGDLAWMVPLGETPALVRDHPALKGVTLPKTTGALAQRAAMMVTKTLLIASEGWGGARVMRAYDKKTGAVLGEVSISGAMGSLPMTYMLNGKQFIAFTVGGQKDPAELIALALPN
jgi:quinoprotein glucose dehydrogenase